MPKPSFNNLIQQIETCRICHDQLPLAPRPIFQVDPKSRVLIVGQAPGIRAHHTNQPFNDQSGERLRAWMDISKDDFYNPELIALLPMGFCYPGSAECGDLPPRKECALHWRKPLTNHLKNITVRLLVGQYAIKWYLGKKAKKNLTETVKCIYEYTPDYIPLPHPSPRNNIWLKNNPWFEKDVLVYLKQSIKSALM